MRFINCLRKSICLDLKNGFFRRWIVLAAPVIFGTVSLKFLETYTIVSSG